MVFLQYLLYGNTCQKIRYQLQPTYAEMCDYSRNNLVYHLPFTFPYSIPQINLYCYVCTRIFLGKVKILTKTWEAKILGNVDKTIDN